LDDLLFKCSQVLNWLHHEEYLFSISGVEDEVEEGGGTIHDGPVADDNDIPADTIIFADAEPEVDPNVAKLAEIVALAKEN